jgi:putative ABC transport system ATP-binding protein
MSEDQLAEVRNRKVGFIFQSFNLLPRSSALSNVELPMRYGPPNGKTRAQRAHEALEAVGLGDRIHHRPNELSGGQQQRVAIARALVNNPSIIMADEPTGNLDSRSGDEIMELLMRLNRERNVTLIIVTHSPEVAAQTGRVIRIRDGKVESA